MQLPSYEYENYYKEKYNFIAGLDEVGRGPLAGPVTAAAVILPEIDLSFLGLNDSKKLSEKKRNELFDKIIDIAISFGIASVDNFEIDKINILQATQSAFKKAIENMPLKPDFLLIDGNYYNNKGLEYKTIVKGDSKSYSIAAASILAKVTRDRWMTEYAEVLYPGYEFSKHKGYATKKHFELIKKNGLSPIHRKTFLIKFAERENALF
jgi:ribonuclease HII